jgi:oxygen-independent coproporphyrinogen-3 oxidase
MLPLSLYVHIPWCLKKCPYCDFNSHAVKDQLPENRYVERLLIDLARDVARYQINRPLQSIFIGGGTPSLFSPEAINRLLRGIEAQISFVSDIEITLEANPSTFEFQKFAEFRAIGINRLSIGVQSFDEKLLTELGRVHSGKEAITAAEMAHKVGFENFNLDLMFGLPKSTQADSERDIRTAMALQPTHLSFYQLTLEPNTYFHRYPPVLPSDDTIFKTQQHCQKILVQHDYAQYEVSAYSLRGKQCRHNLNYWQFGDYLGIGAGAHGKISLKSPPQIIRTQKQKHPDRYENEQDFFENVVTTAELPLEFVMNNLRLKTGFSLAHYEMATGLNPKTLEPALSNCVQAGLLIEHETVYRCTEQGWHFLDNVLLEFVG